MVQPLALQLLHKGAAVTAQKLQRVGLVRLKMQNHPFGTSADRHPDSAKLGRVEDQFEAWRKENNR